jgi:hypothetical protein
MRQNRAEAQTKDAEIWAWEPLTTKAKKGRPQPTEQRTRENMDSIRTTSPSRKQRRTPERQRNIPGSGVTSIRALGITLLTVAQSSRWWPK